MKQLITRIGLCCAGILVIWCLRAQPAITRVEYYFDNDPGYGKATAINITPGTNLSNIGVNINPATLSAGVHTFGIRAKDANNAWSQDNRWLFAKPYPSDTTTSRPDISRVEYYFDNDPGYGKATAVSITPGVNLADIAININPSTLSTGVHVFGIRAKDTKGTWCQDNRWLFAKPYPDDTTISRPDISRVEYYFDNDPGYGKATAVSITPSLNLADIAININPSTLSSGVHVFGIRARDTKGAWCQDNRWLFAKPYPEDTIATSTPKLAQVEYYVDTDPGYGKGVPVAIKDATTLSNVNLAVNISKLRAGDHKLFIRSKDAKNVWSLDNVFDFKVATAISTTSIVLNSVSRRRFVRLIPLKSPII